MISVCFITKNEEKWIGGCIDNIQPLVSEIILVDTGSTDKTVEIAKGKGALVWEIPWPGNFAEARNFSLSKATQPWILKIDPDERIDPKDFEKIKDLTKTDGVAFQFYTRAYTNDAGVFNLSSFHQCNGEYPEMEKGFRGYVCYPSIRLFKNLQGVKYVGHIHESVEPSLPGWSPGKSPVPPALPLFFHHYGQTKEAFREKGKTELYQKLLKEECERNPENWYALFELGVEALQHDRYAAAIEYFEKANQALPNKLEILCNLGFAKVLAGDRTNGEKYLRDCIKLDPTYHDAYLNLGVSRLDARDFSAALNFFDQCLKINSDSFSALRAKGQGLAQLQRWQEAEHCFEQALKVLPFYSDAKVDLGILWLATGKKFQAQAKLQEVLREDPDHPRAQEFLKMSMERP